MSNTNENPPMNAIQSEDASKQQQAAKPTRKADRHKKGSRHSFKLHPVFYRQLKAVALRNARPIGYELRRAVVAHLSAEPGKEPEIPNDGVGDGSSLSPA